MRIKLALLLGFALLAGLAGAQTAGTSAAADKNVKVIGRLGQAVEDIQMHASMNPKAKIISKAKAFQYLVVSDTNYSAWKKILLVNNRYAFVKSEVIAVLPYNVTVPVAVYNKSVDKNGRPTIQSGSKSVDMMLHTSFNYIGTKYVWGGNSLTGGIDCSGFVKELYKQIGVNLPRTAREQARVGQPITQLEDLRAGDRLYFWDKKRGYIGHTGIFLGYKDGHAFFIHSSSNNKGVDTDDLMNEKWRKMLVAARR